MKKFLLAILIGTATVAVSSSCTKEYYESLPGISFTPTVNTSDWEEIDEGVYAADVSFTELDETYYQIGTVQVAIQRPGEQVYDAIPATINGVHYSFSYEVGYVTLFAEDRNVDYYPPETMQVKITLTDADDGGY